MKIEPILLYFYCEDKYLPVLNIFSIENAEETIKSLDIVLYSSYTDSKEGLFQKYTPLTKEQRAGFTFFIEDVALFKSNLPKLSLKEYRLAIIAKWEDQIIRIIGNAKTAKGKSDGKKIQDWIAKQSDVVLEKVTKPEKIIYKKFDDYLSQEAKDINLVSQIRPRFKNLKKPSEYYYLVYALHSLKYFVPAPKSVMAKTLYRHLFQAFGEIGSHQAFGNGIRNLHGNHNTKELIKKYSEEIRSLLK